MDVGGDMAKLQAALDDAWRRLNVELVTHFPLGFCRDDLKVDACLSEDGLSLTIYVECGDSFIDAAGVSDFVKMLEAAVNHNLPKDD